MKKWLKVILLVALIAVVGAGSWIYYILEVKEYEVADVKVAEITEEAYDIVLPSPIGEETEETNDQSSISVSGNTSTVSGEGTDTTSALSSSTSNNSAETNGSEGTSDDNEGSQTESSTDNSDSESSIQEDGEDNEETDPEVTVAFIKNRYAPSFENLQAQANEKIDGIVGRAFDEYKEKKASGESISYSYFYSKYKGAADNLEANTDSAFQVIYGALQSELKQYGFSPSHAEEFKEQYETAKSARQSALLSKAREAL
ncbi:hypothetical protein [Mangrovibacillus cuniculi]|uniref:Uncharacterized protein n=1 Tax=Mangrovibacillus cuniculi TaxID=2593652 RepID=A0A7S8HGH9_9BACI|nr:hypothetical protein [Mangrovibacillus cuniculi]QPC47571.1 hypothetical protein G8O30_11720 [Mangrovibacillus cuniculi]